jgi:hypothetical protein
MMHAPCTHHNLSSGTPNMLLQQPVSAQPRCVSQHSADELHGFCSCRSTHDCCPAAATPAIQSGPATAAVSPLQPAVMTSSRHCAFQAAAASCNASRVAATVVHAASHAAGIWHSSVALQQCGALVSYDACCALTCLSSPAAPCFNSFFPPCCSAEVLGTDLPLCNSLLDVAHLQCICAAPWEGVGPQPPPHRCAPQCRELRLEKSGDLCLGCLTNVQHVPIYDSAIVAPVGHRGSTSEGVERCSTSMFNSAKVVLA